MPKQNQIVELRKMSVEDLVKTNEEKRAELFALKFQAVLGSLEQTHRIKQIKKEIARIELVLGEMRKAGQDTNKMVKTDYTKAVEQADADGKKVREKQLKKLEELQKQFNPEMDKAVVESKEEVVAEESKLKKTTKPKTTPKKEVEGADKNGKK